MTVPILQGRLAGKRWIVGAGVNGYWLGSYEWDKRVTFEHVVQPGWTVYDVGAHVGFYSLLASDLVGPQGMVVAFEPLPRNVRYFKTHMGLNHVRNVVLREVAVSDQVGLVRFDPNVHSATGRIASGGELEVPSITLDEYTAGQSARPPDVIKMDIEGGELRALKGATQVLREGTPLILLATHGSVVHRECCALLASLGFSLVPLTAGAPLEQVDEVLGWKPGSRQAAFLPLAMQRT